MTKPLSKILYLEDDLHISEIALISLRDISSFDVLHCSSGQDAVDRYDSFAPDLLLFDVMLPDMDGPQTLEAIRSRNDGQSCPVVFMTAKAQTHEQQQYMDLGALSVIVKPFDAMMLGDQLNSIWSARAQKAGTAA